MARRYRYQNASEDRAKVITIVVVIVVLFFIGLANEIATNPKAASETIGYLFLLVIAFLIGKYLFKRTKEKHISDIFTSIKDLGLRPYIDNFIDRFSFEGKNVDGWTFRNRNIDWNRIDDLERYLLEKGVRLDTKEKKREIFIILRTYIQDKEEAITRESIKREPQKFASLSGADFEKLLYRLFEAMGYKVEHTGRSGDQGGDLIANKDGERILIQAKCYRDWSVGNEAVQQVVGAMKFYGCGKTMVITTSTTFTPEAYALAQANNTDLISKDELSGMLLKYLGESWG